MVVGYERTEDRCFCYMNPVPYAALLGGIGRGVVALIERVELEIVFGSIGGFYSMAWATCRRRGARPRRLRLYFMPLSRTEGAFKAVMDRMDNCIDWSTTTPGF